MLNTVDALRLFADGQTSMHDARSILMSLGHSRQDFADAVGVLVEEGAVVRFSNYRKGELYAEMYLTLDRP